MEIRDGSLILGTVRSATVRIHWSAPLGVLAWTRFAFVPGAWLGFIVLILLHELGHAAMVWRFGASVSGIDVHALGGVCRWQGSLTPLQRALVAWGGVLAQLAVYIAASVGLYWVGGPHSALVAQMLAVFLEVNVWLMLFNLLPVAPLDGAEAWKLLPELQVWRRQRARMASRTEAGKAVRPSHLRVVPTDDAIDPEVRRIADELLRKALERRKDN